MTPLEVIRDLFKSGEGKIINDVANPSFKIEMIIDTETLAFNIDLLARKLHSEVERAKEIQVEKMKERMKGFVEIGKGVNQIELEKYINKWGK